jgi:hypothetical protein
MGREGKERNPGFFIGELGSCGLGFDERECWYCWCTDG